MIESVTVKHLGSVVATFSWLNGQMTSNVTDGYNAIVNSNDIIIIQSEGVIEPMEGKQVATILFTSDGSSVSSIVVNSDDYDIVAVNSDGTIEVCGHPGLSGGTQDHTVVKETWTRSHHP